MVIEFMLPRVIEMEKFASTSDIIETGRSVQRRQHENTIRRHCLANMRDERIVINEEILGTSWVAGCSS